MQDFVIKYRRLISVIINVFNLFVFIISLHYISELKFANIMQLDVKVIALYSVFFIFILYTSYVFHILIHEMGHLVIGHIMGLDFISIRIFKYIIVKGKKYKAYNINKFTSIGQCLMVKSQADGLGYVLYSIGGCLLNLLSVVIIYILIRAEIINKHTVVYSVFCSVDKRMVW